MKGKAMQEPAMHDYAHLIVAVEDGIARLRLNRPERLNAMNQRMNAELQAAFHALAADPLVRVIVISGEGRAFCAGGDLFEHQDFSGDMFEHEMQVHTAIIRAMLDCPKPIICRLHGAAAGWGATFAFFADMVIAAEDARIHDPHVQLGLSTGDGAAIIWPFLMGHARAKQFLLTGETMTGRQAADFGLVNEALPPDRLDARVQALAERIAAQPAHAVRLTKASVNIPLKMLVQGMMDTCIAYEVATQKGGDHHAALARFAGRAKSAG